MTVHIGLNKTFMLLVKNDIITSDKFRNDLLKQYETALNLKEHEIAKAKYDYGWKIIRNIDSIHDLHIGNDLDTVKSTLYENSYLLPLAQGCGEWSDGIFPRIENSQDLEELLSVAEYSLRKIWVDSMNRKGENFEEYFKENKNSILYMYKQFTDSHSSCSLEPLDPFVPNNNKVSFVKHFTNWVDGLNELRSLNSFLNDLVNKEQPSLQGGNQEIPPENLAAYLGLKVRDSVHSSKNEKLKIDISYNLLSFEDNTGVTFGWSNLNFEEDIVSYNPEELLWEFFVTCPKNKIRLELKSKILETELNWKEMLYKSYGIGEEVLDYENE